MGIAFHLLAAPFQALLHWLRPFVQLESSPPQHPATPPHGGPTAHHSPPDTPEKQRPPRGNWPFTVRPPAPATQARPATKPAKVLRQPGTGRLVIAGRMADVCAELDRLAASEALQA